MVSIVLNSMPDEEDCSRSPNVNGKIEGKTRVNEKSEDKPTAGLSSRTEDKELEGN